MAANPKSDDWADKEATLQSWQAALADWRGDRAALRRAQSPDEAFDIGAFQLLCRRLKLGTDEAKAIRWARVALAVAEIDKDAAGTREDGGDEESRRVTLGAVLATTRDGKPAVSPERLRLMLNTEEPDLFLRLLRGMMTMIDRRAPVGEVAGLVRRWHFPDGRSIARRRLLLDYHEKLPLSMLEKKNA
jgi:CRISPR system Cascade subunit CasB